MEFVHLHLKSEYSLLSAECRLTDIVNCVKMHGQNAVALTDDSVLFASFDFARLCKENGIKAILGCEFSVAFNEYENAYKTAKESIKIILLAKDKTGYVNISELSYLSSQNGYLKVISISDLKRFCTGVFALCYSHDLSVMQALKDIYKDSYYALLCRTDEQSKAQSSLVYHAACKLGVETVAANNVLFSKKDNKYAFDVLCAVKENKRIYEIDNNKISNEQYIKSSEEMASLFFDMPSALENTVKIANACNFYFETGKTFLPEYTAPDGISNFEYLKKLCLDGLKKHTISKEDSEKYLSRLKYELDIINNMGYVDYYLIVMDFVLYAKNNGIPVGPGRGSGVGSLAAYLVGITEIDPIKNGLLFERFLNPERVSMPDFDIDFCDERRYEVIEYVKNKYGDDNFAQIINIGTFADKQALRDAFKVCGVSYSENIPSSVASVAKMLEGRPRNVSQHASGVVIVGKKNSDKKLIDHIPLYMSSQSKVTQFDMTVVEKLGLLKIDFLGLRFLSIIDNCEKSVGLDKSVYETLDDKATYEMLSRGESCGLFQLESEGMQKLLRRVAPKNIKDIAAVISLYRPGPSKSIEEYIKGKNNEKSIKYLNAQMKDILSETYGCMIYQEQVMEICRRVASFSYGHADIVRKAMAKKNKAVMEKERVAFVCGAEKNGVDKQIAEKLFDSISAFAEYAFNKSHASAYSVLAYRTAYLKCHYPCEYMAAMLTSVYFNNDKKYEYAKECKRLGISILPPDINKSDYKFSVENGNIRIGLSAIKNVGEQLAKDICKEREKSGAFESVLDLVTRLYGKISEKALTSFALCGAFLCFGKNRNTVVSAVKEGLYSGNDIRLGGFGQTSFFGGNDEVKYQNEYSNSEIRENEISLLGFCINDFLQRADEIFGKTLYIKINNNNEKEHLLCLDMIKKEKGTVSIVLFYEKNGKILKSTEKYRLTVETLNEIRRRLGNENCVIK